MRKKDAFKVGDHVEWNSEAGRVRGTIKRKVTSAINCDMNAGGTEAIRAIAINSELIKTARLKRKNAKVRHSTVAATGLRLTMRLRTLFKARPANVFGHWTCRNESNIQRTGGCEVRGLS
jgi:di/tripeptidase